MSAKLSVLEKMRNRKGIDGLLFAGWRGSLVLILGLFVALFFAVGFWWVYWRSADMDTWMVYEAFLFDDGLRQEYFDHPGYLTILLLGEWFRLLHAVGLLPANALSALPPVADTAASAAAWMHATQAARLLSLLLALSFLLSFAGLMRVWLRDWRIAALSMFMLAFSGGMMMEARTMRTELIAAGCAYTALLILLVVHRAPPVARLALVALASCLAMLAMTNKVHIVFLLAAMAPLVVILDLNEPRELGRAGVAVAIGAVVAAVVLAVLAWPLARAGLFDPAIVAQRQALLGTGLPVQQVAIALWFSLWIALYAVRARLGAVESVAAVAALVAGGALGLLTLELRYDLQNVVAVLNPFETMFAFAAGSHPDLMAGGAVAGGSAFKLVLDGVMLLAARLTFVLASSPRPTIFLEWAVFAMLIYGWRQGHRRIVLQAAAIIGASLAVDLVGTVRGLKLEYFLITDPLVIMAAGLLLVKMPELLTHRLTYPLGAALICATVAVGLAEPVKHSLKRDKPLDFCVPHYGKTQRVERFSFCP